MAQTINTNMASLTAQRNLAASQRDANQAMERLSSGLRINSAKDDAAGLAISNRLTAQINGINQAVRNANDGLSVSQVAEGALAETSTLLQRMRELAVQSANASNSAADRTALQTEVTQLVAEMDRIATNTKFGTTALLDGTYSSQSFQVGANASETMSLSISSAKSTSLGSTSSTASTVNFANFRSANAGTVAATPTSDVTAQTLTLETNGVSTNVAVAAGASAATVATSFNAAQTDVVATALTGVRIDINDSAASDTMSLTINGTTLSAIAITSDSASSAAITAAIQGNSTLAASLTVTDNGDGTVDIVDSTGADITIDDLTLADAASSDLDATVQSLTAAGSTIGTTTAVASGSGVVMTGHLSFTAADATKSYALFSSDGSGNLTTATSSNKGTGATENITFTGFETANNNSIDNATPASAVTAQTLTLVTDGVSDSIAIAASATAQDIATSVNNNLSGISATATTGARLTVGGTLDASTGTYTLQINGVSLASVDTDAATGDTAAEVAGLLVTAINTTLADSIGKTLTAVDNGDGSFDIIDATGADIVISDFTESSTAATLSVRALDATGALSGDAAVSVTKDQGTRVTGDVVFAVDDTTKSYQMFSSASAGNVSTSTTSIAGTSTISSTTTTSSSVSAIDISTVAGATSALTSIDAALTTLDSNRATLGAVQNRFDSVISNLSNVSENTSAARSRIMDADFAAETAALAKTQILQQAGISILAQANAQPQNILALLQ